MHSECYKQVCRTLAVLCCTWLVTYTPFPLTARLVTLLFAENPARNDTNRQRSSLQHIAT